MMKVFQKYKITGVENQLQCLLADLKENLKTPFSIDRVLTKEYAECSFAETKNVACFKTKSAKFFESSVCLSIDKQTLCVINIISPVMYNLGVERYNMILTEFVKSLRETISLKDYSSTEFFTSAEYKMSEHMSEEAYRALDLWVHLCPKNEPFCHESDEKMWFDFLYKLRDSEEQPSESVFERWLREEINWPLDLEREIDEVIEKYSYSLKLFRYGNEKNE